MFYSVAASLERHRVYANPGRLTKGKLAGLDVPVSASAYVCGPASFMTDMRDALTALSADPLFAPAAGGVTAAALACLMRRNMDCRIHKSGIVSACLQRKAGGWRAG